MRTISILGSTGSIGTQALQIAALHPDLFRVGALTAHSQAEALFAQVRAFRPQMAGLTGLSAEHVEIPEDLRFCDWRFGQDALLCAARGRFARILCADTKEITQTAISIHSLSRTAAAALGRTLTAASCGICWLSMIPM